MHERNTHRLKIMRPDSLIIEAHVLVVTGRVASNGHGCECDAAERKRQTTRQGNRLDAGHGPNALDEAAIKLAPATVVITAQEGIEGSQQNAVGIKSRISFV